MQSIPSETAVLIEALRNPRCYPHPVSAVRVIETHISYVLLTGDFAYKIKKPLRLDFLDFSSLAARRHFCEEELRLNRRTAAELYLAVLPIAGTPQQPQIAGGGPPFEVALQMRQFDPDALLSNLADCDALTATQIDAFAAAVSEFHARIEVAAPETPWAEPERVGAPLQACFDTLQSLEPGPENSDRLRRLADWSVQELARLAPLFAARKQGGCVRECHGDLHLANVAWVEDRPLLFDCLEFDPELRWIDVQSEIAFAFMDLLQHGRPDFAWRFVNAYLERSGDYAGVALLPFYATYRALVRGKVTLLRGVQEGRDASREWAQAELARYIDLAERFARRHVPLLAITTGLSGSGKSTVSQVLAEECGAIRLRSDVERKRLHGLGAAQRASGPVAQGLYDAAATRRSYDRLAEIARALLGAGRDVIVDAAFLQARERDQFAALAEAAGARFRIVACEAPLQVLRDRVAKRAREGRDASDAELPVLEHQRRTRVPLGKHEWGVSVELRTDLSPGEVAAKARALAEALH